MHHVSRRVQPNVFIMQSTEADGSTFQLKIRKGRVGALPTTRYGIAYSLNTQRLWVENRIFPTAARMAAELTQTEMQLCQRS